MIGDQREFGTQMNRERARLCRAGRHGGALAAYDLFSTGAGFDPNMAADVPRLGWTAPCSMASHKGRHPGSSEP
jgi:hypothetical protein